MQQDIFRAINQHARERADAIAVANYDEPVAYTWREYLQAVHHVRAQLAKADIVAGDRVALLTVNRAEFFILDTALLSAGAIPVSIYHTSAPGQIAATMRHCGAKLLIAEPQFIPLAKAVQELPDCPATHFAILDTTVDPARTDTGWPRIDPMPATSAREPEPLVESLHDASVLTLVYTSGSGGESKAVPLLSRAVVSNARAMATAFADSKRGVVICYLPLSHTGGRFNSYYMTLLRGDQVVCVPDYGRTLDAHKQHAPSWFFAVPRIWEKILDEAMAIVRASANLSECFERNLRWIRSFTDAGHAVPFRQALDAGRFVPLTQVRQALGLQNVDWAGVATAPSGRDMLESMMALGIELYDGWGMTECLYATANPPGAVKIGTVGKPLPGMRIEIATDGEILVSGGSVYPGYFGAPQSADGAPAQPLYTGDLGAFDADGYLRITGRKKEIIINSAGKNMVPANIEMAFAGRSPLIERLIVVGDARPYNVALVQIAPEAYRAWRQQDPAGEPDTAALERLRAALQPAIEAGNRMLSRVEQIKKWMPVFDQWEPGGLELTPTLKLRRANVLNRYAALIERLYA
ncbi:MAG: AMP-dependent synthetase/ligase [Janthinobacterium lividum]